MCIQMQCTECIEVPESLCLCVIAYMYVSVCVCGEVCCVELCVLQDTRSGCACGCVPCPTLSYQQKSCVITVQLVP
jgi:hypothetical protein